MGAPDLPREGAAASRLREGGSERPGGKGHCRPPSESRTFLSLFRAAQARGDGARPASEPLLRCRVLRARPSCHQRGGGGVPGRGRCARSTVTAAPATRPSPRRPEDKPSLREPGGPGHALTDVAVTPGLTDGTGARGPRGLSAIQPSSPRVPLAGSLRDGGAAV